MKKSNGITLIALIITIIVMLILVAVTINVAVNGGIFGYAGNAAKETKEAKEKEEGWASLESGMSTDALIAKYTTDREADLQNLKKYFEGKILDSLWDEEEGWINNNDLSDAITVDVYGEVPSQDNPNVSILYFKYHGNIYTLQYDNTTFEGVEVNGLNDSEALAFRIQEYR